MFCRPQTEDSESRSRSVTPSPEREIAPPEEKPSEEASAEKNEEASKLTEEEKEREFQEQERLRREVANLESSIQTGVVLSQEQLQAKGTGICASFEGFSFFL